MIAFVFAELKFREHYGYRPNDRQRFSELSRVAPDGAAPPAAQARQP